MMTDDVDKLHIDDSDCLEAMDHLYAYLNGEVNDKETQAMMEHHLGHCKSCFSRAEIERKLNQRLKESNKDETPESLQKRLKDIMDNI